MVWFCRWRVAPHLCGASLWHISHEPIFYDIDSHLWDYRDYGRFTVGRSFILFCISWHLEVGERPVFFFFSLGSNPNSCFYLKIHLLKSSLSSCSYLFQMNLLSWPSSAHHLRLQLSCKRALCPDALRFLMICWQVFVSLLDFFLQHDPYFLRCKRPMRFTPFSVVKVEPVIALEVNTPSFRRLAQAYIPCVIDARSKHYYCFTKHFCQPTACVGSL